MRKHDLGLLLLDLLDHIDHGTITVLHDADYAVCRLDGLRNSGDCVPEKAGKPVGCKSHAGTYRR